MKKNNIAGLSWAAILVTCIVCISARAENKPGIACNVGYSLEAMADADPKDVEAGLSVWAVEIGKQFGVDVTITLYQDRDLLVKDFNAQKLDFVYMSSLDYLQLASALKVKAELARYKDKKATQKYLIITSDKYKKTGLASLKNKKLAIYKKNRLGMFYLNTELLKIKQPEMDRFFGAIEETGKESKAVLSVFFGQADICVVSESNFQTVTEMNPQIEKKLHIMHASPDMVDAVGFWRKDYPPSSKDVVFRAMRGEMSKFERGKQILLLFNTDSVDYLKEGQLGSVTELMAEYKRLKGRGR